MELAEAVSIFMVENKGYECYNQNVDDMGKSGMYICHADRTCSIINQHWRD